MADQANRSISTEQWNWGIAALVILSLVVFPALILAETTTGALAAFGIGRHGFAVVVMVPALILGGLSMLVMQGSP